jgi:fluoroacetyl-CoA thioesterase
MFVLQVGTAINVTHDRATQVGDMVRAAAEVTSVDGRRITFAVKAFDGTVRFCSCTVLS